MKKYQIWIEGFNVTGQQQEAQFVGEVISDSFSNAIDTLIKEKSWNLSYFNPENNTYYGCRFFDSEANIN